MSIEEVSEGATADQVNVRLRVIKIDRPFRFMVEKMKQNLLVADTSGVMKFVVWEEMAGKFELESSYIFKVMMSFSRRNASFANAESIENVVRKYVIL